MIFRYGVAQRTFLHAFLFIGLAGMNQVGHSGFTKSTDSIPSTLSTPSTVVTRYHRTGGRTQGSPLRANALSAAVTPA